MKDYKKILEGVVNIIKTTEKSDIGFANICTYIGDNCPELKEKEEHIIKWLIAQLKISSGSSNIDRENKIQEAIAWLEKQGEQKPIIDFKADDWYVSEVDGEIHKITSTNKVEPKFHEGDWVVSEFDKKTRCISEVHRDEYNSYYVVNGKEYDIEEYDRIHHLWTIEDAKDGDVLVTPDAICIFKRMKPYHFDIFDSYCELHNDIHFGLGFDFSISGVCPATKEQRDKLMKAIADAGYEFDFDKKELKKIESKSTENIDAKKASEEYRNYRMSCGITDQVMLDEIEEAYYKGATRQISGKWSEEDEQIRQKLILFISSPNTEALLLKDQEQQFLDWLKSLRHQNHWKPSERQMWAIENAQILLCGTEYNVAVCSLIDDLKKFKD